MKQELLNAIFLTVAMAATAALRAQPVAAVPGAAPVAGASDAQQITEVSVTAPEPRYVAPTLREGEVVWIQGHYGGFDLVRTADGHSGWTPADVALAVRAGPP